MNRESWLGLLAENMAPRFAELGFPLPPIRMAVGFTSKGSGGRVIGECWSSSASADKVHEVFIRPDQVEPVSVAATLAHELAHAAVGIDAGHTGNFAKVCLALGLKRPMTATSAGPAFIAWVEPILEDMPPFPHAKLTWFGPVTLPRKRPEPGDAGEPDVTVIISSSGAPKQGTRLLKAHCKECGYTVRLSKKWAALGALCPTHGAMAIAAAPDKPDDGDE